MLADLLSKPDTKLKDLSDYLDKLSHDERVAATRSLPGKFFPKIYALAESGRKLFPNDLVSDRTAPFTVVRHIGTNNMPAFRNFTKAMYKDEQGNVSGRNVQTWELFTGPGYFTVPTPVGGRDLVLDYVALPQVAPPTWPRVTSNSRGISYFVFRGLNDVVRAVSQHVVIGSTWRDGKLQAQYFLLVREDPG